MSFAWCIVRRSGRNSDVHLVAKKAFPCIIIAGIHKIFVYYLHSLLGPLPRFLIRNKGECAGMSGVASSLLRFIQEYSLYTGSPSLSGAPALPAADVAHYP